MTRLALGGLIIKRRPLAVVLREVWERAMVCARTPEQVFWLNELYEGYEQEAEQAGRN